MTPFRNEKNTNWEGAYRVPAYIRWPGKFPAGTVLNGLVAHEDWLPTFAAIAGAPDIKEQLREGGGHAEGPVDLHLARADREQAVRGVGARAHGVAAAGVERAHDVQRFAQRRCAEQVIGNIGIGDAAGGIDPGREAEGNILRAD